MTSASAARIECSGASAATAGVSRSIAARYIGVVKSRRCTDEVPIVGVDEPQAAAGKVVAATRSIAAITFCAGATTGAVHCFLSHRIAKADRVGEHPNPSAAETRSFRERGLLVASQSAEIIDLKAYRERRSQSALPRHAVPDCGILPLAMMPSAFIVFWPAWVFTPAIPLAAATGGQASP
ncbi:MAG TPA: hypothetical protein VGC77_04335 [Rhodopseudomonas sp.]|uniref:hypothetical protein n=1 Tax=Rhodopseudomonas sp. TaxID=1078 RepID=UPI002ED9CDA5